MKTKSKISTLLLLSLCGLASAQSITLNLKDAIEYGIAHNTGIQKNTLEIEKSDYKVKEAKSGYLPQIKGSATLNDNLKLQTSILPGEVFGQPGTSVAVKFGTTYNITAGLDASQVLFDASQLVALQAASESKNIAILNKTKSKEQLTYDIASAYYAAQITTIQKNISQNNLVKIDSLLNITKVQYENGYAKKIDYDRLFINRTNVKTEIDNVNINYEQQLLLLKYYMGMPLDSNITLFVADYSKQDMEIETVNFANNTDLQLLQTQRLLNEINMKQLKASYLPTLGMSFRYAYQAQQNTLDIFSSQANWFPVSYLAFNLNVPIFDGFNKSSKINQTKIGIEQNQLDEKNLVENLKYQTAKSNSKLNQNQASLTIQLNNIKMAEEVFDISQAQFKGGMGSMSDLLNADTSLKEAQINYLNALVQIKLAELELLKTTGNLSQLNN